MDRLKQEWKETRIPEEVCLRARNLAWAKINDSSAVRRRLAWAAATSAFVVLTVIVWIWCSRGTPIGQTRVPSRPQILIPAGTKAQDAGLQKEKSAELRTTPHTRQITQWAMERPIRRAKVPVAHAEEPERVVLNFILPKTGARMIWIMDSSFQFDGGVK